MIARTLAIQSIATLAALSVLAGCSKTPEPTAEEAPKPKTTPASTGLAGGKAETAEKARPQPQQRKVTAKPVAEVKPSEDDPAKGKWTLEDATKGLPPGKTLTASIETDLGTLSCKLLDDKAPITVANFVGLARGIRPWKTPEGTWEKKPAYDGTIFHRIIKGFMIQGGDAKKNGTGEAGYVIPDEVWEDGSHDRAGLLCMANRGKNTNSAQFFITDAAAFHLDNGYTIFGECGPEELVHKLASVEVKGERPVTPPVIKKVTITRQ
ncbi:peptidylprolyl isomerase [Sorangium sp. So ce1000]|uniref:peptidylprolyl isomerase n=1 Tax=Sorangium sp. So ce1000 TaxID=3133325 RepID=UPI003F618BB5